MSVVHELLSQLEEKETSASPWLSEEGQKGGVFTADLPAEILNDFYDLKEYVRIASLRGQTRVISVASSLPGEGSSTIAAYLGYLLTGQAAPKSAPSAETDKVRDAKPAEQDPIFSNSFKASLEDPQKPAMPELSLPPANDILLVDANLHQPGLHRFFSLQVEGGLAEVLEHQLDWRKCVRPIRQLNLKVLTAGRSSLIPAELLGSEAFRKLVKEWRSTFSYVIFDSAPVLRYVDALTLATSVDGVILVVCAGKTRWEIAQDAKRKLAVAQANLLGVALNRNRIGVTVPLPVLEKN